MSTVNKKHQLLFLQLNILLTLFLLSCSERPLAQLQVLYGQSLFRQSKLERALTFFYSAELHGADPAYIDYNIATTYSALGEPRLALERLENSTPHHDLDFAFHYNRGVAAYRSAHFLQARNEFVEALKIKPEHRASKINLELSLRNLARGEQDSEQQKLSSSKNIDSERLLNFIARQESWLPPWQTPSSESEEDW